MHRKLIKEIISHGTSSQMEELEELLIDMIDDLKAFDYDEYVEVERHLHEIVYDGHLDECLAKKWTESMRNKDGTKGAHWSIEQTSQYASEYNKYDWYAILNMMYSEHYNPKFDTQTYIELAKDWLKDENSSKDKIMDYYTHIVCKK